jgi:SUMO ligase MMS21 Smc5/6 complex component
MKGTGPSPLLHAAHSQGLYQRCTFTRDMPWLVGSFMQVLDMDTSGISVGERINNFSRRIYRLQRAEGDAYVDKRSISDDFLVLRGCLRHGRKRTLGDLS